MTNYLEVKNLSKSFDSFQLRAERFRQNNYNQAHSEYAQTQRRRNQNHGFGQYR